MSTTVPFWSIILHSKFTLLIWFSHKTFLKCVFAYIYESDKSEMMPLKFKEIPQLKSIESCFNKLTESLWDRPRNEKDRNQFNILNKEN